MHKFYPEEIEKLRKAYMQMREVRSEQNGSAYGEHMLLVKMLSEFGVRPKFEASSQVENFVEHVITYESLPEVY